MRLHGERARVRVLFASDLAEHTSEQQLAPFRRHRKALRDQLSLVSLHTDLATARGLLALPRHGFDVVGVKLSFHTAEREARAVVRELRRLAGSARLVYFDGDDDLAVQWPAILEDVDLWVKKHAFRDRARYGEPTVGKHHLTDWVHRRFGVSFDDDPIPHGDAVPAAQRDKIFVGTNLALDDKIQDLAARVDALPTRERDHDVVCRAGVDPDTWLYHLRKDVTPVLESLAPRFRVLTPTHRVPFEVYLDEMRRSRICVAPFGYGEICWRDFEAILCGCLLVKPDMSHVETYPDLFDAGRTYVPVRWDLADLAETCVHYLEHPAEREAIAREARRRLDAFYREGGFVDRVAAMLERLGLGARPRERAS